MRTVMLNAFTLYNYLIRLVIIIFLISITFIIPYSSTLINIYIGSNLFKKYNLLLYIRLYLIKIILNIINEITEMFIKSIESIKELNFYRYILLFYSFIYLFLCYIFIKCFGIVGLIIINCLNIFGRIIINYSVINKYIFRISYSKIYLFSLHYVLILIISYLMLHFSRIFINNSIAQAIFYFGLFLTIICLTLIEEKQTIHYIYCSLKLKHEENRSLFFKEF